MQRLRANGATAIGTWLTLAGQIADAHLERRLRHAILLTDGQNGEKPRVFHAAVAACVGGFACDCRGVGTDWRVDELRTMASALLGSVDIVADRTTSPPTSARSWARRWRRTWPTCRCGCGRRSTRR